MKKCVLVVLVLSSWFVAFASARTADDLKFYDQDGDKIFENLAQEMHRTSGRIPVIVTYREDGRTDGSTAVRIGNRFASTAVRRTFDHIPSVAASLTPTEIENLRQDPMVRQVELDAKVHATMDTARASFGVQAVRAQFHLRGNHDRNASAYTTGDIVIAILDTGVNSNHPDFRGKVLYFKDLINGQTACYDDQGHGTHVAGVAAGAGKTDPAYSGVAPGAALVVYKVLDSGGSGTMSDVIDAIDDVISHKAQYNIRVMNLSLSSQGSSDGKDALSLACNRAMNSGIVVVLAAGNDGPERRTIGSPAAAAVPITVGAGADAGKNGFYVADFSSRGPTADNRIKPDLWAPGVRIDSPRMQGGYSRESGTSFAAPFVSGVAALMLDANPSLTPVRIKSMLMASAVRWVAGGHKSNDFGFGRLQAYQAIAKAKGDPGAHPPAVPDLMRIAGTINTGEVRTYTVNVANTRYAVAATVINQNSPSTNLMLELYRPDGSRLATRAGTGRQLTLAIKVAAAGSYTLKLTDSYAAANFLLDISAKRTP